MSSMRELQICGKKTCLFDSFVGLPLSKTTGLLGDWSGCSSPVHREVDWTWNTSCKLECYYTIALHILFFYLFFFLMRFASSVGFLDIRFLLPSRIFDGNTSEFCEILFDIHRCYHVRLRGKKNIYIQDPGKDFFSFFLFLFSFTKLNNLSFVQRWWRKPKQSWPLVPVTAVSSGVFTSKVPDGITTNTSWLSPARRSCTRTCRSSG